MPTADDFETASRLLAAVLSECRSVGHGARSVAEIVVLDGGTTATAIRTGLSACITDLDLLARAASSLRDECERRAAECRAFDSALEEWRTRHRAWMLRSQTSLASTHDASEPTRPTPSAAWIDPSWP